MKYVVLCILILLYLLVTWRVQEGFKNARTYFLYESGDWEMIKNEITPILEDTEKDRHVVLYGKNQDDSLVQDYLQNTADPGDTGVKIMIEIASSIMRDKPLKEDIFKTLNPKSGDTWAAWTVYTFKQGETESIPTMMPLSSTTKSTSNEDEENDEEDENNTKKDGKKNKNKKQKK
jgi:hypothetical protein